MSRSYPRLTIEEFGEHLLGTGDLDPVYIALNRVGWHHRQKKRFLVAYWCLYHCGAASWLSAYEGIYFWNFLLDAARNTEPAPTKERWPRGHERRHWRGQQAIDSCTELKERYGKPEEMVLGIMAAGHDFAAVSAAAQGHRGFGPWISFKICDMLDRCLGHHVDFKTEAAFNGIFKDPWQAALKLWKLKAGLPDNAKPRDEAKAVAQVVEYLIARFDTWQAPPLLDRPVGVQEIETILCKWKSHMNGHYPLWNDIDEIRAGLRPWTMWEAPRQFDAAMPVRVASE